MIRVLRGVLAYRDSDEMLDADGGGGDECSVNYSDEQRRKGSLDLHDLERLGSINSTRRL
jgi:hypothetical protein